jgi:hypothetical protein
VGTPTKVAEHRADRFHVLWGIPIQAAIVVDGANQHRQNGSGAGIMFRQGVFPRRTYRFDGDQHI